jgi:hypothetical protein
LKRLVVDGNQQEKTRLADNSLFRFAKYSEIGLSETN